MKYSLRKSFSFRRRRKDKHDDESMCTNIHSASNLSLVKVFEPRHDDDDDPVSPTNPSGKRPFDRLTSQIRQSFRNTLHRQRPGLESTNSNKRLLVNSDDNHQTQIPTLYPYISIGLSCPLTETEQFKPSSPAEINQSVETNHHRRSFRKHFSFLRKQPAKDDSNQSLTLTQRFHSLRRSLRSASSSKTQHYLLSDE